MRRILYVEDDPINALVMKKLLQAAYEVIHAADGESCLEFLAANQVDLVLMDINLGRGKMDGIQTLAKLKSQEMLKGIPVFAVTSYALPGDQQRFLNEGFDEYISKPVERQDVLNRLQEFLG